MAYKATDNVKFVYQRGVSDRRITQPRSTPIWRYQDLPKLLWTLSTGCLWFARADTLEDAYEGSTTRAIQKVFAGEIAEVTSDEPEFATQVVEFMVEFMTRINRATVRNNAVSCWHMGEYESAAMWKLYLAAGQGVAIRSSIDRLLRCLPDGTASHPTDGSAGITPVADTSNRDERGVSNVIAVDFGPMTYVDYNDQTIAIGGRPGPRDEYFRKRRSFEHEREFRALIFTLAVDSKGAVNHNVEVFPGGGVAVPVDLDVLIDSVYISPGAPSWFKQVIETAIERFGRRYPVIQSRLDEDPVF